MTGGFAAPRVPDLRLSRLSEADARSLATARVAGDAARATIEWLVENAQGNPLALIEPAASSTATRSSARLRIAAPGSPSGSGHTGCSPPSWSALPRQIGGLGRS